MELAVKESLFAFILLSGQVCAANSRIYVHEDIAEKFLEGLKMAAEGSIGMFGDPNLPSSFFGPIVDKHQFDRVSRYIEKGKTEGTLLTGGEPISGNVLISTSQTDHRASLLSLPSLLTQHLPPPSSKKKFSVQWSL